MLLTLCLALATSNLEVKVFEVKVGTAPRTFTENTYVLVDPARKSALLVDPGAPDARIEAFLKERGLRLQGILNTHGHGDHVGGNAHYSKAFKVEVYLHPADQNQAAGTTRALAEGALTVGDFNLTVLTTPGHSPGSVCFHIDGKVFSGDTLFKDSIGRVWGSSKAEEERLQAQELESIKKRLLPLPDSTTVYPGHGESTTIGRERTSNPWLN